MKKIITAAAVIILLITGDLYAAPQYSTESPQSGVTQGRFESDADHFVNVRNYANMDFSKWWGVVSYKRQNMESPHIAQLGLATRFGNVFTSLSYRGNGFLHFGKRTGSNINIYNYTEEIDNGKTWKIFDASPMLDQNYNLRNEASLLLGLADMGFLITYASNYQSNTQEDFAIGDPGTTRSFYKSFKEEHGYINPGITWGMTKELIPGRGVKPQVNLDLNFYKKNQRKEDFFDPSSPASGVKGIEIELAQNYFSPGINLGLYGFNFLTKDKFSLGMDLEYGIKFFIYNNDYCYPDSNFILKVDKIKKGYVTGSTQAVEASKREHDFAPFIGARWEGERLGLVGRIGLPLEISKTNETDLNILQDGTGKLEKDGENIIATVFEIIPRLDLALQWAIVPSRLFLNVGGQLRILTAKYINEEKKHYTSGTEDNNDPYPYTDKRAEYNQAGTNLYLGLTFDINKNLQLQALMGVDSGNNLNLFSSNFSANAGGLINFGNILLALKF